MASLEEQVLEIIRNNPEVILESIKEYESQQQQQVQVAQQAFLQEIKTQPQVVIGSSPITGSTDYQVVLVEFSDFQCPLCAKVRDTVGEFIDKNQDKVTLIYKHLPHSQIHPEALDAAKAAYAAHQQGKFWSYHDALFSQQQQLGEELYLGIAEDLGLDLEQFNRDCSQRDTMEMIQKDIDLATKLGIGETPFFFFQGSTFSGALPLEKCEELLSK